MAKLGDWLQRLRRNKAAPASNAVGTNRNRHGQWRLLGLIAIVLGGLATASVVFFSPPPRPQAAKPVPAPKTRDIGNSLPDVEKDAWRAQSAAELESMKRDLAALKEQEQAKEREAA